MSQDIRIGSRDNLEAVALFKKIIVFRHGLQTETDEAVRRRVTVLCAQAEADLAHLKVI